MVHEEITQQIIKAAMTVHTALGPGLLESAYHTCLAYELANSGMTFERQRRLPVVYQGITLDAGYRIDFLVENRVIVELKSVERLLPIHTAQLLSYLKLSGYAVGLLVNFNVGEHPSLRVLRVLRGENVATHSSTKSIPARPMPLNFS